MIDVKSWEENNMIDYVEMIIILLFLIICSYYDIKKKVIYTNVCVIFTLLAIIVELVIINKEVTVLICGIVPSIFIYIISIISNESIGKGDSLIFIVIGIIMGCLDSLLVFILSLIITVIYSIPLIFIKHKKLKTSLPFTPFVLSSFIMFSIF